MNSLKSLALALPLLFSFAAHAQEYETYRRKTRISGFRNAHDEMRVVSRQIVTRLNSGGHRVVGLAQVQVQIPVCGAGNNNSLDVKSSEFSQQLAAMGGPVHLFESQKLDLGFYISVPRGVAIADVCRATPTLLTLSCGYRQPLNLQGIPSRYRTDSVEGITCRYKFEGRSAVGQEPFIDVTLTSTDIEVFNGL